MLVEWFPFLILNNAIAFVYMHIFSLTLCFDDSFYIDCYPAGVSNKHCLLSLFHCYLTRLHSVIMWDRDLRQYEKPRPMPV